MNPRHLCDILNRRTKLWCHPYSSDVRNLRHFPPVVLPSNACMEIPHAHAYVFSCFLLMGVFAEIVILLVLWVSVHQTPLLRETL
jgi:hypothetical protein